MLAFTYSWSWKYVVFNREGPEVDQEFENDYTFYKQTHLNDSGDEKLKTWLNSKPCATPSHLVDVDWLDIGENSMLCNGGE